MNKLTILSIETSCDETAVAVVDGVEDKQGTRFSVRGNALISQIDLHRPYGGVFPTLAKREHAKNLVPLTRAALEEAELLREDTQTIPDEDRDLISKALEREPELAEQFFAFVSEVEIPEIDAIAVTAGPGLPPALWVGVNFAQALAIAWHKPLVAVNHMEGHILAALATEQTGKTSTLSELVISTVELPILALLISGGHTELVLMREWLSYELIGQTRDDAVGEAFDKVARLLGLPYPGGPEISRLAEEVRGSEIENPYNLPRPMLNSDTCDFSFAGLKTAARYLVRDLGDVDEEAQKYIALEFEDATVEVLLKKTLRALEDTDARTLALGGGVCANTHVRRTFTKIMEQKYPEVSLRIPTNALTTDNAVMIALSGFYHAQKNDYTAPKDIVASGNASLT